MIFPDIDPVAFHIGPFPIRWYGIAYIMGIVLGAALARSYTKRWRDLGVPPRSIDDFTFWATLGVLVGGRVGFILLYHPAQYWADPWQVLQVQRGGMAFHGGLLGVALATILFCRGRWSDILRLADILACVVPIGLLLGRLANFVNGELWGRVTTVPWAMVFPTGGPMPRHPSQLYEALLEGILMFAILNALVRVQVVRLSHGLLAGAFFVLYGASRTAVEHFREPDAELILGATRGQVYSVPMILLGAALIAAAIFKRRAVARDAPLGGPSNGVSK